MSNTSRRQQRQHKKNTDKKIAIELEKIKKKQYIEEQAREILSQQNALKVANEKNMLQHNTNIQGGSVQNDPLMVINYIADRNGCGYYRCVWPFELLATYKSVMTMNSFIYHFEQQLLSKVNLFRFQRQATDAQLNSWKTYLSLRRQNGYKYKMQYEIDDLLMEIEPQNKIAYDYFDINKKENHMHMLRTSDSITFSTESLKDIYVNDYKIDPSKIKVVKNYLPQFVYSLPYRNGVKEFSATNKPRIFWSGSASHIAVGGDLDFLVKMIISTVDEYQWVFQGTLPQSLVEYVKNGKIEFIPWVPIYGLANVQFYRAKPDICLAPLTPSKFNSCKSDLKYLESSALGAPCITSTFSHKNMNSPYDTANAEICIENDADIWKSTIDHLIKNPSYYSEVSKNQYNFLNNRWMESNLDQWMNAIK
jgi:hypothetical protein